MSYNYINFLGLTLMTCQSRPRMRWGRPSMMSWGPILMILHPIEEAELRASVWFSWILNTFSLVLLIALSSTVSATDVLISLLIVCVCVCVCVCACLLAITTQCREKVRVCIKGQSHNTYNTQAHYEFHNWPRFRATLPNMWHLATFSIS